MGGHQEAVCQRQSVLGLRQCGLAEYRLQEQPRPPVVCGVVRHELGVARVEYADVVEALVEDRFDAADERGHAGDLDHPVVMPGQRAFAHQPLLVSHQHLRAGRKTG